MTGFRLLVGRSQGALLSLLLHGGVAAIACVSISGLARGGGSSPGAGNGLESGVAGFAFRASLLSDRETIEPSRVDDAEQFRSAVSEEPAPVEISDPPSIPFDPFLTETRDGVEVARAVPSSGEVSSRFDSSADRFERLPASSAVRGEGISGNGSSAGGSGGAQGKGAGVGSGTGDGAGDAVALFRPRPVYPTDARRKSIEGAVVVEFTVEADGSCSNLRIAESSGFETLDQSALRAVQEWRYKPAELDGRTVATDRSIRIVFKLDQ
jgi:protein TonB